MECTSAYCRVTTSVRQKSSTSADNSTTKYIVRAALRGSFFSRTL
jgi:hypothetical protein